SVRTEFPNVFYNRSTIASQTGAPHILIVEDTDIWQFRFSSFLRHKFLNVNIASNLEEAISWMDHQYFVAFIVDLNLNLGDPTNSDGLDFVQHICVHCPSAHIMVASGIEGLLEEARKLFGTQANIQFMDKNLDLAAIHEAFDGFAERLVPSAKEQ